jgi:hypothetical protein
MRINPLGINNPKVHYENCTVLYRQECSTYLTAVVMEHLSKTSFMASIQAQTEPPSGLPLHVYFMLPCLIRYIAVCPKWIGFHT